MKKWEYLNLYYYSKGGNNSEAEMLVVNGETVFKDSKKSINMPNYLNELGKDGWELVNVEGHVFYFKRQAEE